MARFSHLKPHVHFVKGTGHNSFYDVLTGYFYRVYAEDDPHQLRQNLEDAGLLFKSDGIVPFKTEFDISALSNRLQLRELQIRLGGRKENNCRERLVCDEDSPVRNERDRQVKVLRASFLNAKRKL